MQSDWKKFIPYIFIMFFIGTAIFTFFMPMAHSHNVTYSKEIQIDPQEDISLGFAVDGSMALLDKSGEVLATQQFSLLTDESGNEVSLVRYSFNIQFTAENFKLPESKSFNLYISSIMYINASKTDIIFTHTHSENKTLSDATKVTDTTAKFSYHEVYNLTDIITSWYAKKTNPPSEVSITVLYGVWLVASGRDESNIPWNTSLYVGPTKPTILKFYGPSASLDVKDDGGTSTEDDTTVVNNNDGNTGGGGGGGGKVYPPRIVRRGTDGDTIKGQLSLFGGIINLNDVLFVATVFGGVYLLMTFINKRKRKTKKKRTRRRR